MITDNLKNNSLYYGVSSRLKTALEYLQNNDFKSMEPGKYEIDGDNIYALVNCIETKVKGDSQWEAHRKYIDIQYICEGSELMGYNHIDELKVTKEYDNSGDYLLLDGDGSFLAVKEGCFAIFFPEDAHMPGLAVTNPEKVKKVIVKVRV